MEEVRAMYLALPAEAQMPELLADYDTLDHTGDEHWTWVIIYNYRLSLDMKCIVK